MSSHLGVSCDSCMKSNFAGRRYKCLSCEDYDLCGRCHDNNAHLPSHPMQCILSKTAHELFYAGESIASRTVVSLTCPYCGVCGFLVRTLLTHCVEEHSVISTEKPAQQAVMCPICAINLSPGNQCRYVSLVDHLLRTHDDGSGDGADADVQVELEDDDDEGLPLYILAERLLASEEGLQRRPLSRQATIRSSRGGLLGGQAHGTAAGSFYIPFDTPSEGALPIDSSYATILFAEDPLFDFDSPLSDVSSNAPFLLASTLPTSTAISSRTATKKANLPIAKAKRDNPLQQAVLLNDPLSSEYQAWSRIFPSLLSQAQPPVETAPTLNDEKKAVDPDRRSLLGKILKASADRDFNHSPSPADHAVFCQALVLSSLQLTSSSD